MTNSHVHLWCALGSAALVVSESIGELSARQAAQNAQPHGHPARCRRPA